MSKGGKKWYITFVHDFSKYTKVYLLKSKNEAEEMFLKYKAEVENQLDRKIKKNLDLIEEENMIPTS